MKVVNKYIYECKSHYGTQVSTTLNCVSHEVNVIIEHLEDSYNDKKGKWDKKFNLNEVTHPYFEISDFCREKCSIGSLTGLEVFIMTSLRTHLKELC